MILLLSLALAAPPPFDLGDLKRRERKQLAELEVLWAQPAEGEERLADLLIVLEGLESLSHEDHAALAPVHAEIGRTLGTLERWEESTFYLDRAAHLGATVRADRIRAARALEDWTTAQQLIREQIEASPPDAVGTWWIRLGEVRQEAGERKAALQSFRKGLEAREAAGVPDDPVTTPALLALGDATTAPRRARDLYQRVVDADPLRASDALLRIGTLFLDQEDPVGAIPFFSRAREQARTPVQERRALEGLILAHEQGDVGNTAPLQEALQSLK